MLRGYSLLAAMERAGAEDMGDEVELSSVHAKLKAVESTLHEKKDLQKQLLAYIKTKPARDGLKAAQCCP